MASASRQLVSILIPCYNAEPWVARAIESALAQTYRDTEVIVLDDGSTDGSLRVIKRFGDRIRWETGPNRGVCYARNRLLEMSQGEWLQYLDSDDYLLPQKIEMQMCVVEQTKCQLVISAWLREDGTIELEPTNCDAWVNLFARCTGNTIANLWHRDSVLTAGGWDPRLSLGEENELVLRLLTKDARVAYSMPPMAVASSINPDSLSRRPHDAELRVRAERVQKAVVFLNSSGQMTVERRRASAAAFLELARGFYHLKDRIWREMEQLAHSTDPALKAHLRSTSTAYGAVYGTLGFRSAELYLACRKWLQKGRMNAHSGC